MKTVVVTEKSWEAYPLAARISTASLTALLWYVFVSTSNPEIWTWLATGFWTAMFFDVCVRRPIYEGRARREHPELFKAEER